MVLKMHFSVTLNISKNLDLKAFICLAITKNAEINGDFHSTVNEGIPNGTVA